jgi:phosphoglycerate dehydrogenase-like enzyme
LRPLEFVVGDEAAIVEQLADVDVLVSMGFSATMAEVAPLLRLVQVPGAGLDRIDAELQQGRWESQWAADTATPALWPELAGKKLGILGFGHIGQALARRAAAFDMRICAVRRQAQTAVPNGIALIDGTERLDDLLRQAD